MKVYISCIYFYFCHNAKFSDHFLMSAALPLGEKSPFFHGYEAGSGKSCGINVLKQKRSAHEVEE